VFALKLHFIEKFRKLDVICKITFLKMFDGIHDQSKGRGLCAFLH